MDKSVADPTVSMQRLSPIAWRFFSDWSARGCESYFKGLVAIVAEVESSTTAESRQKIWYQ